MKPDHSHLKTPGNHSWGLVQVQIQFRKCGISTSLLTANGYNYIATESQLLIVKSSMIDISELGSSKNILLRKQVLRVILPLDL